LIDQPKVSFIVGADNPAGAAKQLNLFAAMIDAYGAHDGPVTNVHLYGALADKGAVDLASLLAKVPVGKAKQKHSLAKRSVRWMQQNLRRAGVIERVPEARGKWRMSDKAKAALTAAEPDVTLVGFSTNLGLALWTSSNKAFEALGEPIHLLLTSPPYPIREARAYGAVTPQQYIDFICGAIEPIVKNLAPGASVALNVTNDCFQSRSPARVISHERLCVALEDRFGLSKMDSLIWHKTSAPPGPIQWASINRMQLNQGYELVLWFTNDPSKVFSDNRRVLQPHSEKHLELIAAGGEKRTASYSDGAYRIKEGSFGNITPGKIPTNVLSFAHSCADQRQYKKRARELGLPVHGAPMPLRLAKFLIEFLTEPGHLVVDRFAGSMTTAKAAELTGRRWLAAEMMAEYVRGGAERFRGTLGFASTLAVGGVGPCMPTFASGDDTRH